MRGLDKIPCLIWLGLGVFFAVGSRKYGMGSLLTSRDRVFSSDRWRVDAGLAAIGHFVQLIA